MKEALFVALLLASTLAGQAYPIAVGTPQNHVVVGVGDTCKISSKQPFFTTYIIRDQNNQIVLGLVLPPFATAKFSVTQAVFVHSSELVGGGIDNTTGLCGMDCFPPTTLVATPSGEVAIKDLRQGDTVTTATGCSKISSILRSNATQLIELDLEGSNLRASRGHALRTTRGWVAAADIVAGDQLVQGKSSTTVMSTQLIRLEKPIPVFNLVLEDGRSFNVGNGIQAKSAPARGLAVGSRAPRRRVF